MIEILMYQCSNCGAIHRDKTAIVICKKCGDETCEYCGISTIGSKYFVDEGILCVNCPVTIARREVEP